jgi:hypothetical protein
MLHSSSLRMTSPSTSEKLASQVCKQLQADNFLLATGKVVVQVTHDLRAV